MLISIVIPTFNEAADIGRCLDAVLRLTYPSKEVIVVDDSTDATPDILVRYEPLGVRVLHRDGRPNGCCGARNLGMAVARGDVVVLLNADVVLAPDFLDRIAEHYAAGADFVVVESRVLNTDSYLARYVDAKACMHYDKQTWLTWSEGFSCRRAAAAQIGGIPGDYPMPFCRDGLFGVRLQEAGFRKRLDRSIVAHHIAPATFVEYWRVRRTRGYISALFKCLIDQVPLPLLPVRVLLKNLRALAAVVTVLPVVLDSVRAATYSSRGRRDVLPFVAANVIERMAFAVGEWRGVFALCQAVATGRLAWKTASGQLSNWRQWRPEMRKSYLRIRTDA